MDTDILEILKKPTCSVDEAARVCGLGRNAAYEAVKNGELETLPVRGRKRVLTAALRKKLGLEAAAA